MQNVQYICLVVIFSVPKYDKLTHLFIYIYNLYIYYAIIGKDYSDLSNRHQRRRKAEIRNDIEKNISDPLLSIGLTVETVTLKEINTNNSFQISISNNVQQQPKGEVIKEGVHIPEICYLLLKYGVSFKCYHELAMECTELPRSYKVYIRVCVFVCVCLCVCCV